MSLTVDQVKCLTQVHKINRVPIKSLLFKDLRQLSTTLIYILSGMVGPKATLVCRENATIHEVVIRKVVCEQAFQRFCLQLAEQKQVRLGSC